MKIWMYLPGSWSGARYRPSKQRSLQQPFYLSLICAASVISSAFECINFRQSLIHCRRGWNVWVIDLTFWKSCLEFPFEFAVSTSTHMPCSCCCSSTLSFLCTSAFSSWYQFLSLPFASLFSLIAAKVSSDNPSFCWQTTPNRARSGSYLPCVLVYKALHSQLPQYLTEDCQLLTDIVYKALHSQLPQYLAEDVSSWSTSAADHCDRLMSQEEHELISETGVFPSLDHVSGTLCLLHYVTETSHLYSLRDFWRHFGICRAAAHSDCCFCAPCTNIFTYLLTYLHDPFSILMPTITFSVKVEVRVAKLCMHLEYIKCLLCMTHYFLICVVRVTWSCVWNFVPSRIFRIFLPDCLHGLWPGPFLLS